MPLYDYQCLDCGKFSAFKKMAESSLPASCPDCERLSARLISAPNYALLNSAQRSAHERNEKSAHAPSVVRKSSCGCHGEHTCKPSAKPTKSSAAPVSALQKQVSPTARPWMLGH
ncbi:MAG: zinc ribbon domain-containing protein [Methylococcaceae bacterium]|jgi:putative FmdB family regulatory protein